MSFFRQPQCVGPQQYRPGQNNRNMTITCIKACKKWKFKISGGGFEVEQKTEVRKHGKQKRSMTM